MARIFIDVHPDGTFKTGAMHGDPVEHAAKQSSGVVTYMTADVGDLMTLNEKFKRFASAGCFAALSSGRWSGEWQLWGARCIRDYGEWFERVDGSARAARAPKRSDELKRRVLKLLDSGPMTTGVIRNRMRSFSFQQVDACLADLAGSGATTPVVTRNPTNGRETTTYRLAQV